MLNNEEISRLDKGDICPICQEPFIPDLEESIPDLEESIYQTKCKHNFHAECLKKSCVVNARCPFCRQDIQSDCVFIASIKIKNGKPIKMHDKTFYSNTDKISLSRLNLTNLVSDIGLFKSLTQLDLSNNNFTDFPREVLSLDTLEFLNLNSNKLSVIPDEISSLTNLNVLLLICNNFTIFPSALYNVPLGVLYLDNNLLTELPMEIGRIPLFVLSVASNPISILPPSYERSDQVTSIQRSFSDYSPFFRNLNFLNFSFTGLPQNERNKIQDILDSVSLYRRGTPCFFLI